MRTEVISRTGHLTKFDNQAYRFRDDDLWLLPTGEVALMGMHQGEILAEADLPKRYMAYTVCWRREAGAAGKDTRGMQRLHEFHKVELVKLCPPDTSEDELWGLLADCERALQVLQLPYRVLELCAGDLTFSASRVFDLEVYSPGVDRWLEVSSVSLITDFQARRGRSASAGREGATSSCTPSTDPAWPPPGCGRRCWSTASSPTARCGCRRRWSPMSGPRSSGRSAWCQRRRGRRC